MQTTVPAGDSPTTRLRPRHLRHQARPSAVHLWGHDGGIHGSSSVVVATADGRHSLAFNFNGDWSGTRGRWWWGSSAASRAGLWELGSGLGLHRRNGVPYGVPGTLFRLSVLPRRAMHYRTLGRTGIKVSPYCLGAMMFGADGNPDHGDCVRMIHRALDAGINFV
ncbi:hypothetical protein ACRAWF_44410 [Streptomyces sp. L7]